MYLANKNRIYACIDLKSFYASCECRERNLDPISTNLVVADVSRTSKTICLAVSPSLKAYGISGRARLYEVISRINEVNKQRKKNNGNKEFIKKSFNDNAVRLNPNIEIDYIIAEPRMSLYLKYSADIYNIYLKFLSKEDIFVYSIDEVFCDLTDYLKLYKTDAMELVSKMIMEVYHKTGITATAGIGTNLYLAKVAMDIISKHTKPNNDGVRIAYLDEILYRKSLWNHVPLTDFWRIGKGLSKTLNDNKLYTMGDICLESIKNEDKLFKLFGVNAELIIDHAWGNESCTIKDIKNYKPENTSLSTAQVLHEPYDKAKARIIVYEMVDNLVLDMVSKRYLCEGIVLTIGYDTINLKNGYSGIIKKDYYGRNIPKEAHGTIKFDHFTSSTKLIEDKAFNLYNQIVADNLLIRRIGIALINLKKNNEVEKIQTMVQMDLFDHKENDLDKEKEENKMQKTVIDIKKRYGKNSLIRGIDLLEGATTRDRNNQIGGHKA